MPNIAQALSTLHQMYNGFPRYDSALVQDNGQTSFEWLSFFRQIWQATNPKVVTLTDVPVDPTLGVPAFQAAQPNMTIFVNLSPPSPLHIHLWDNPTVGWTIRVKDAAGVDATNPITVHPHGSLTVDGAPTYVMHTSTPGNFDFVTFVFNGTDWSVF